MNSAPGKTPNYFMYFPGSDRWSAEMLAILSTAPYGGAEISEVDRIGRKLRDHVGDDDAWFRAWREGGDLLRARAAAAAAKDHALTAASTYLRACSHYQHVDHFRQPKDEHAMTVFRQSLDCFRKFTALTDRPRLEAIEIPYQGSALPAYSIHAENTGEARPACIVRFGGFDTQKDCNTCAAYRTLCGGDFPACSSMVPAWAKRSAAARSICATTTKLWARPRSIISPRAPTST